MLIYSLTTTPSASLYINYNNKYYLILTEHDRILPLLHLMFYTRGTVVPFYA